MKIIIEDYKESWTEDFLKLKKVIQSSLKNFNASIDHIGSTSVTGLGAKPIIDILVGLENECDLEKTIQPMQQNGFTYYKKYERQSPNWTAWTERRYYVKLKSMSNQPAPGIIDLNDKISSDFKSVAHIHTLVKETAGWKRHIAFRDYLRAHPKIRDEYYLIKKEISKQEFENGIKYNEAKNDFVKDVERKAVIWFDNELAKKKNPIIHQSLNSKFLLFKSFFLETFRL